MIDNVLYLYTLVVLLLTAHFVGDFVLQSHWMASNKSKNILALALHVVVYTAVISIIPAIFAITDAVSTKNAIYYVAFNGVAHFAADYFSSKLSSKLLAQKQMHNFFVVIGFDQLIHQTCLIMSLVFMLEKVK